MTAVVTAPPKILTRQTAACVNAKMDFLGMTAQCLHLVMRLWIAATMEPPLMTTKLTDAFAHVPLTTLV
jgi:hypothetical protein